jgi:allophanate hydrolase subunit 2
MSKDLLADALNTINNEKILDMCYYLIRNGAEKSKWMLESAIMYAKYDMAKLIIKQGSKLSNGDILKIKTRNSDPKNIKHKDNIKFIDWLIENYPEYFETFKDILPPRLKKKYDYLYTSDEYNLW